MTAKIMKPLSLLMTLSIKTLRRFQQAYILSCLASKAGVRPSSHRSPDSPAYPGLPSTKVVAALCLLLTWGLAGTVRADEDPLPAFGRYAGTIYHKHIDRNQLAKIDFIVKKREAGLVHLMAVLSVYFGSFRSREYISVPFSKVTYDISKKSLTFIRPDQTITLAVTSFDNQHLSAEIRSDFAGDIGDLVLYADQRNHQVSDPIGPIAGQYRGSCQATPALLQLQTARTTSNTVRLGNPFGAFDIRGTLAINDPQLCPDARNTPFCVTNVIYSGSYNYFKNSLILFGNQHSMDCKTLSATAIDCGICKFNKERPHDTTHTDFNTKLPSHANSLFVLPKDQQRALTDDDMDIQALAGTYRGYLHHEYQNLYQVASLEIVSFPGSAPTNHKFVISAIANLFFGEDNSTEVLSFRFEESTLSRLDKFFVLERAGADIDAILQITSIDRNTVQGIWYSLFFGRVGEFRLEKRPLVALPSGFDRVGRISGEYQAKDIYLQLGVRLASTPFTSENPFFPLTVSGYLYYRNDVAARIPIIGGSFDFYTGLLGLHTGGGRSATGSFDLSKRQTKLLWPTKGFGRLVQPYKMRTFRRLPSARPDMMDLPPFYKRGSGQ